jgi:hypothetical protein
VADPTPGDLSLAELYAGSRDGAYPEALLAWRYRLARARARQTVAESQLRRLSAMEAAGREVKAESVHAVEQELADAAGALEFCREMLKSQPGHLSGQGGSRK